MVLTCEQYRSSSSSRVALWRELSLVEESRPRNDHQHICYGRDGVVSSMHYSSEVMVQRR